MRRHAPTIGVLVMLLLTSVGCGREGDEEIARVNQQPIKKQELWELLEETAGQSALHELVERQLLRQEATKRNVEVGREELETRMALLKDHDPFFPMLLEETGTSEDYVASMVSRQMLRAKLVLTEDDRQRYFEQTKEQLQTLPWNSEAVVYRRIVLSSKEEAEAVHRELKSDPSAGAAKFAELAKEHSLDDNTRARGGMAGWLAKGKEDPELERVLFSLKPGEISEPFARRPTAPAPEEGQEAPPQQEFWAIVMVEKQVAPREVTLADNADVIEEAMMNEPRYQYQLAELLGSLRGRADIEILSPRYEALGEVYRRSRQEQGRQMAPAVAPNPAVLDALEGQEAPQGQR